MSSAARDSERLDATLDAVVRHLSADTADALAKARAEGLPDREDVVEWTGRVQRLVLHQRDCSTLRSELPWIAERLARLLGQARLPSGTTPADATARFLETLPRVRSLLAEDVEAAFEGDPAARSHGEILAAYPAIQAISVHRLAHELHRIGAHPVPRIMSEHAHARTGIDIHPGARIGRRFFIDHGTGVVIGETCEIGDRVVLYQGVTLGAVAPRKGGSLRGLKRHPTLEDDVTIYAGATILGGATCIGRGSVIGGNVWLTGSVPPCSRVQVEAPRLEVQRDSRCEQTLPERQLRWDL
jgi:serine O-acetyltransferase